jgi:tetratricopeptide (TPR) repeat protein
LLAAARWLSPRRSRLTRARKGVELYLEAVEKDLTPTQREKMLQDAVAAFEQAAKLVARENHFHGQALFALQRYDEGLALMAKSDRSGDAREQLASEFRADGHYELAFKFVESALTAGAPCERLRANLLLDLGRTEDGLY